MEGKAKPLKGKAKPLEGKAKPLEGKAKPLEGKTKPLEGKTKPLEGKMEPWKGRAEHSKSLSKALNWARFELGRATMPVKKTYYPPKTFDDDLTALGNLFTSKGWSFSNIDNKQLVADALSQRTERAEHDATESTWLNVHEKFGLSQEERYKRFSSALNAARGAFRNDKAVMKELNKFNRSMRGPKKKTA